MKYQIFIFIILNNLCSQYNPEKSKYLKSKEEIKKPKTKPSLKIIGLKRGLNMNKRVMKIIPCNLNNPNIRPKHFSPFEIFKNIFKPKTRIIRRRWIVRKFRKPYYVKKIYFINHLNSPNYSHFNDFIPKMKFLYLKYKKMKNLLRIRNFINNNSFSRFVPSFTPFMNKFNNIMFRPFNMNRFNPLNHKIHKFKIRIFFKNHNKIPIKSKSVLLKNKKIKLSVNTKPTIKLPVNTKPTIKLHVNTKPTIKLHVNTKPTIKLHVNTKQVPKKIHIEKKTQNLLKIKF